MLFDIFPPAVRDRAERLIVATRVPTSRGFLGCKQACGGSGERRVYSSVSLVREECNIALVASTNVMFASVSATCREYRQVSVKRYLTGEKGVWTIGSARARIGAIVHTAYRSAGVASFLVQESDIRRVVA